MKKYLFAVLLLKINIALCQLNGIYTIGGSTPDYNTINDAVSALTTSGISGPVIFNIRPGTYNEKIIIPAITGSSATNQITFQSELLDSSTVKIQNNSTVLADNYIFYLNGADFISIKYLSLYRNSNSANGCRVIRLENGAHWNTVESCHLKGKTSISNTNHELIYSTSSKDTSNVIKNNSIENGWYGVFFNSSNGSNESGNRIEGNNFIGIMYGINASYFSGLTINNNKINTSNAGITVSYGTTRASVSYNNIITAGGTGISLSNCTTPVNDSLKIIGNMVKSGSGDGIVLFSSTRAYVFHNSVLANGTNQYYPLHATTSTLSVKNNIIKNATSTACILYSSCSVVSDYNVMDTSGPVLLGYDSYSFATLNAWSGIFLQDQHSYQANPTFNSFSDLHITGDIYASNNGQNLGISHDLDSDPRTSTPDIGADEFEQPDNDAGTYAITNIVSPMCTGTTAVVVTIRNYGELPLTQATINWSVNGIIQPAYNWTGNLAYTGISSAVSIGSVSILQNQTYNLKTWTTSPNNLTDPLALNDTIVSGTIKTKLAGNYTIGGVSPDYVDVASAISDLSARGVCAPVVFDLRPGDYIEAVNLLPVIGADNINTITFQSQNHDSTTTRILKSDSDFGPYRLMINAPNAAYYNFKQLTIGRYSDPSGNTNNLVLLYLAKHITFEGCIFKGAKPYSGQAIEIQECSYITIKQCLLELMSYGIKIQGPSMSSDSGLIISNNILKNIASTNIVVDNIKDSLIIANNRIMNDTVAITSNMGGASGINVSRIGGIFEITSNQVTGNYNSAMSIGNLSASINGIYNRNISNNFIAATCPVNSIQQSAVGFYDVNYLDFIHNSIRVNRMPANPNSIIGKYRAALEFGSGSQCLNINMLNNCFESDSSLYLIYDYTSANIPISFSQFNYNNFYIKYPAYTQIASWTASWPNGYNTNSIYVDPMYLSGTDLHVLNPQLVAGTPTYVMDDIDGDVRATIPTIGADECTAIATGINVSNKNTGFKIVPNPANAYITVAYEGNKNASVQIISIDGKIMFEKINYTSGETIDLSKCEEGIYTVSLKTQTGNYFSKIVIIK